jgi:hypothetical protein
MQENSSSTGLILVIRGNSIVPYRRCVDNNYNSLYLCFRGPLIGGSSCKPARSARQITLNILVNPGLSFIAMSDNKSHCLLASARTVWTPVDPTDMCVTSHRSGPRDFVTSVPHRRDRPSTDWLELHEVTSFMSPYSVHVSAAVCRFCPSAQVEVTVEISYRCRRSGVHAF